MNTNEFQFRFKLRGLEFPSVPVGLTFALQVAFNTNDPVVLTQQTAPLGGDGVSSNPFNDRRKFMDEGKLRKVSGRLFGDAPESAITTSTTATTTHAAHVEALGNAEVGLRRSSRLASQGAAPSAAPAG